MATAGKVFFLTWSWLFFVPDQCRAPGWHSVCGAYNNWCFSTRCAAELFHHCIHSCIFMPNSQAYEFIKRSLAEGAMSNKDIAAIEEQERIGEAGSVWIRRIKPRTGLSCLALTLVALRDVVWWFKENRRPWECLTVVNHHSNGSDKLYNTLFMLLHIGIHNLLKKS